MWENDSESVMSRAEWEWSEGYDPEYVVIAHCEEKNEAESLWAEVIAEYGKPHHACEIHIDEEDGEFLLICEYDPRYEDAEHYATRVEGLY